MNKQKIFVIDDERDICDILVYNLQREGYQTASFLSADEALLHGFGDADLLLLDVMMPGKSGFELAKILKADTATRNLPIIFITAKDSEDDTLQGFDLGGDDYVTKPFSVKEVVARVKAVLQRSSKLSEEESSEPLSHEGLIVNVADKTVSVDGKSVALTKTEYEMLCLLLRNKGKVFSRSQLLKEIWPEGVIVTDRTVDVNITRMRKKIGRYASSIVTRQGFGYYFEA